MSVPQPASNHHRSFFSRWPFGGNASSTRQAPPPRTPPRVDVPSQQTGLPFAWNGLPFNPSRFGYPEQAQPQAFAQAQTSQQSMRHGPPPASQSILNKLPMVTVSELDLQEEANSSCSICLDEHTLGDTVLKLPCGHIFHRECVVEWLHKHCTCPVCRYELGTDNADFERQRKQRMMDRKLRFRLKDLQEMSVAQLRALMHEAGVSSNGCIEKQELIDRFKASSHVEVLDSSIPQYSHEQLLTMSPGELRRLLKKHGVRFDHCLEKSDLIAELRASNRIHILNDDTTGTAIPYTDFYSGYNQSPTSDGNETKENDRRTNGDAEPESTSAGPTDFDQDTRSHTNFVAKLNALSIRELRTILQAMNLSAVGLLEKSDLIAAIASERAHA